MLLDDTLQKIIKNPKKRFEWGERDLGFFTWHYLSHYAKKKVPPFHVEIYRDLQNDDVDFVELVAFRGCAKSTMASLALPLWSALYGKKKFIILCSDTFIQAKTIISNIIAEIETNKLILEDFGDMRHARKEWTSTSIVLKNGVRILARSKGQQIRGLRHLQHRPDLIVADDVENKDDVRSVELRDKTEEWFLSDVVPAKDIQKGKIVLIGNLLHTDSLMSRMKKKCVEDGLGEYKEYSLLDEFGNSVWEDMFPTDAIEKMKAIVGKRYFLREFLLKIVPDDGQVVEKIAYYDTLPNKIKYITIGCDLAISEKETADYTAFVVAGLGDDGKTYCLHTEQGRWNFNTTLERLHRLYTTYKIAHRHVPVKIGWEDVAYQRAGIQEAKRRYKLPIIGIPRVKDKRSRLQLLEPHFTAEQILLRKNKDADLAIQILNFGVEAHDDLMDAGEIAFQLIVNKRSPKIEWL